MKKVIGGIFFLAAVAVLSSSCRVHKGCEAYSKLEVKKTSARV